jgi:hypothetical protein
MMVSTHLLEPLHPPEALAVSGQPLPKIESFTTTPSIRPTTKIQHSSLLRTLLAVLTVGMGVWVLFSCQHYFLPLPSTLAQLNIQPQAILVPLSAYISHQLALLPLLTNLPALVPFMAWGILTLLALISVALFTKRLSYTPSSVAKAGTNDTSWMFYLTALILLTLQGWQHNLTHLGADIPVAMSGLAVAIAWLHWYDTHLAHLGTPHQASYSPYHASHLWLGASLALLLWEGGSLALLGSLLLMWVHAQQTPRFHVALWRWKHYLQFHQGGLLSGLLTMISYGGLLYTFSHQWILPQPLVGVVAIHPPLETTQLSVLKLLSVPLLSSLPWSIHLLSSHIDAWMSLQRGGGWFQSVWASPQEQRCMQGLAWLSTLGWVTWIGAYYLAHIALPLPTSLLIIQATLAGCVLARISQQQVASRFHKGVWEATSGLLILIGLSMLWLTLVQLPELLPIQTVPLWLNNIFNLSHQWLPLLSWEALKESLQNSPVWKLVATGLGLFVASNGICLLLLRSLPFCSRRLTLGLAGMSFLFYALTTITWLPDIFPKSNVLEQYRSLAHPPIVSNRQENPPSITLVGTTALLAWEQLTPLQNSLTPLTFHTLEQALKTAPHSDWLMLPEALFYNLPTKHPWRQEYHALVCFHWWGWEQPTAWSALIHHAPVTTLAPWLTPQPQTHRILLLQQHHLTADVTQKLSPNSR